MLSLCAENERMMMMMLRIHLESSFTCGKGREGMKSCKESL